MRTTAGVTLAVLDHYTDKLIAWSERALESEGFGIAMMCLTFIFVGLALAAI